MGFIHNDEVWATEASRHRPGDGPAPKADVTAILAIGRSAGSMLPEDIKSLIERRAAVFQGRQLKPFAIVREADEGGAARSGRMQSRLG